MLFNNPLWYWDRKAPELCCIEVFEKTPILERAELRRFEPKKPFWCLVTLSDRVGTACPHSFWCKIGTYESVQRATFLFSPSTPSGPPPEPALPAGCLFDSAATLPDRRRGPAGA